MKYAAVLLIAIAGATFASGCWYTSHSTESPVGTGCSTSTYGLGLISSSNTNCEQSAQPPVGAGAQATPVPGAQ